MKQLDVPQEKPAGWSVWKRLLAVVVAGVAVASVIGVTNFLVDATRIPTAQADEMNAQAQAAVKKVEAEKAAIATARRTVFIGDSYSQGTGASDKTKRWTSLVSKAED